MMKRLTVVLVVFSGCVLCGQSPILVGQDMRAMSGQRPSSQAAAFDADESWDIAKKLSLLTDIPGHTWKSHSGAGSGRGSAGTSSLRLDTLAKGQTGRIVGWNFKVEQIIDETNVILRLNSKQRIWVEGYPTEGLVDEQLVRVIDHVEVVDTVSFQTVAGAKASIWKVKPLPKEQNEILLASEIEDAKYRLWKPNKGAAFKAKFISLSGSTVTLETTEKKKLRISLSTHEKSEQELVKRLHTEQKDEKQRLRESKEQVKPPVDRPKK